VLTSTLSGLTQNSYYPADTTQFGWAINDLTGSISLSPSAARIYFNPVTSGLGSYITIRADNGTALGGIKVLNSANNSYFAYSSAGSLRKYYGKVNLDIFGNQTIYFPSQSIWIIP
jgi:hypothetical protein